MPPAMTPIVPLSSAPSCAALSIPRARPETTTSPSRPRSCASPRAKRQAAAEALRAPTIATAGRSSRPRSPLADQQRRRVLELGQQARVEPLAKRQIARAELLDRARSRARHRPRSTIRGALPPPRRARSGSAASAAAGAAEAREQLAEGDRADARASDQPQPVDQVVAHTLPFPMRGSVPAISRRIFVAVLPQHEQRETEQHREIDVVGRAISGRDRGADRRAMPATDEIRLASEQQRSTPARRSRRRSAAAR